MLSRLFAFSFCLLLPFFAQAEFKVPSLQGPVMDEVGYIHPADARELSRLLYEFNQRGVAQVQVLVVPTLDGMPIEQASIKITDAWKLGEKKKDNGVLFLIAAQEHQMRIEVGQGLEGAIPDVYAKRIIADEVIPLFKNQQTSEGIVLGVHEILSLADKEFAAQNNLQTVPVEQAEPEDGRRHRINPLFIILFLIIVSILGRFGGGRGRFIGGGFGGGGFGGFGGGGGGGWSGGGGGFSGGGSSGSW